MKKLLLASTFLFCSVAVNLKAQEESSSTSSREQYGRTLNFGIGVGYYGYVGHPLPAMHFDYEFDVAKNFTLAPFITVFSYRDSYYWGDPNIPSHYYYYRETVIPVGVKGAYYFDDLLNAGNKWDFYLGASLGFAFRKVVWENGFEGNSGMISDTGPLYLDAHVGTEYHLNENIGLFVDLSTGLSTFGFAFHL